MNKMLLAGAVFIRRGLDLRGSLGFLSHPMTLLTMVNNCPEYLTYTVRGQ